jgi:hypothetical protein
MGGLNSMSSLAAMPKGDAILLWNLIGQELGLRSRLGYYEHTLGFIAANGDFQSPVDNVAAWQASHLYAIGDLCTNDTLKVYECTAGGTSAGTGGPTGTGAAIVDAGVTWKYHATAAETATVRTFIPFNASIPGNNKLFAVTKEGIYDVTAGGVTALLLTPTSAEAFPSVDVDAGVGSYHVVVNSAGHFLVYCDEKWGYYIYVESTNTWTRVTSGGGALQISGLDPAAAVFATVWKNRLFLVERGTTSAWYLDLYAIQGVATELNFAGKFAKGGHLVGLWSWTYDGGAGPDDLLVAVSSAGDVVIYQGSDPSIPGAFVIKGAWNVGTVPSGRRIATEVGGELLLATGIGLLPMSKLVTGMVPEDRQQYVTYKISSLFSGLVSSYGSYEGWAIRFHPQDNALVVTYPKDSTGVTEQLVMSMATKGWSRYRGLPILACDNYQGKLYFGTADGRICVNDGYVDNVTLISPADYDNVAFSGITAFDRLGSLKQKAVRMIRGNFTSDGRPPNYNVQARYKYDTQEAYGAVTRSTIAGAVWDTAQWDVDAWPGVQDFASEQRLTGATGIGPEVALAFNGKAAARVVLIGFDVFFTEGGLL